jgi:hypothetical protein
MSSNKRVIFWSAVFLALLACSLLFYLLRPFKEDQRILFFPTETTNQLVGEMRKIFHLKDVEESMRKLIQEMILGPIELKLGRALPKTTKIRSILVRDKKLFLDFSYDIIFSDSAIALSFQEMIQAVKKTITFNFPWIEDIVVFVEGQQPETEHYE